MVKLTGPSLALAAAGSVGGEITFSNWKGKPYLKQHRKPKQPRSPAQVAIRAAMQFLSKAWSHVAPVGQGTWETAADTTAVSPFNAYCAHNLERFRRFQSPTQAFPATDTGPPVVLQNQYATGGVRHIEIGAEATDMNDGWGHFIHHVAAQWADGAWDNIIHLQPIYTPGWWKWTWTPLDAGTYWICFDGFSVYGKHWGSEQWRSAVVTA